ncbi:single-stranded-DNA-specific exonuclease RecJ [Suttonella ornithocola]|uniref:Single-stranded-DNA-specific exonuclease RecJ n=1 Tax=Suttonella ornithocola TaxID=279832 RepID=A0A380MY39_9GAMM|nr:single-stranded-DNA-specific exonuclease RecJ [Suttonella ornithocola]SUO97198.1 Single-stranded-DNA-specific exonuclease recJ [Suttonella ornithocola]
MPKICLRPKLSSPEDFSQEWHPLVREIYAARLQNAQEVEKHLKRLLPPEGIPDIYVAARRLSEAIDKGEQVLIYGDYDVDGANSTALMVRVLKQLGAKVSFFIPNRLVHGYGLSLSGIEALTAVPDLLITVDNGIRSHSAVEQLVKQGVDVIVTDHHEPDTTLPNAFAVVNPKRQDSQFGSPNLSGVGVVFYLLLALRQFRREQQQAFPCELTEYLDLVALGTIADIVPLDYNNRILTQAGLRRLQSGQGNIGIRALCAVAGLSIDTLSPSDIGFAVAPRLNAVGRLEDMQEGVCLLLTDDWATANDYAHLLDELNRDRKALENEMVIKASATVDSSQAIASAYLPQGHEGVIGIVASRLKSRYQRPALVATDTADGQQIKASLRSINGVNIHQLLEKAATQLPEASLHFGGHAMAAGLTVDKNYYVPLVQALNQTFVQEIGHIPEEPLYIDGELPEHLLDVNWARYLEQLEPWGAGLPIPTFCNTFTVTECRKLGAQHTRLMLRHPQSGKSLPATWFFHSVDWQYGETIRAVYQVQVNRFYGDERLNLLITYAESPHYHLLS